MIGNENIGSQEYSLGAMGAMESDLPPVLTVVEVAKLLRVNRNTVYELFQRKEIPGGRKVGRCIRFSRDTVIQWLQGNVLTSH